MSGLSRQLERKSLDDARASGPPASERSHRKAPRVEVFRSALAVACAPKIVALVESCDVRVVGLEHDFVIDAEAPISSREVRAGVLTQVPECVVRRRQATTGRTDSVMLLFRKVFQARPRCVVSAGVSSRARENRFPLRRVFAADDVVPSGRDKSHCCAPLVCNQEIARLRRVRHGLATWARELRRARCAR